MRNDGSYFLSKIMAEQAVDAALALFDHLIDVELTEGRRDLHVVVMDPGKPWGDGAWSFSEAILYEESVGDVRKWKYDYQAIARGKAKVAWRHQADSRQVVALMPHLLTWDDVRLPGGIFRDGIAVGTSGVQSFFDEAIGIVVAGMCRAFSIRDAEAMRDNPDAPYVLGAELAT